MSRVFDFLSDESISIWNSPENANLDNLEATNRMLLDFLDTCNQPVTHIVNMSATKIDLEGIMQLAAGAALGEKSVFRHPMIKEVLVVAQDPAIVIAAQGITTGIYSSSGKEFALKVFGTVDEALAYARSRD